MLLPKKLLIVYKLCIFYPPPLGAQSVQLYNFYTYPDIVGPNAAQADRILAIFRPFGATAGPKKAPTASKKAGQVEVGQVGGDRRHVPFAQVVGVAGGSSRQRHQRHSGQNSHYTACN